MTPLPGVALVGCGLIGQKRLNSLPPGTVRIACDLDIERARRSQRSSPGCRATESIAEAVSAPDVSVVVIATVNSAWRRWPAKPRKRANMFSSKSR